MLMSLRRRVLIGAFVLVGTGPVLPAQSEFSLAPVVSIPLPFENAPQQLRALDVTADGLVDLVVLNESAPAVQVLVAQGGLAFAAPVATHFGPIQEFDVGDVNGDGWPDVVGIEHAAPTALQAHLGDGLGGFPTAGSGVDLAAGGLVFGLLLLDIDEDGDLDALIAQSSGLRKCLGDGTGGFGLPAPAVSPNAIAVHGLHALDANSDGHVDLIYPANALFNTAWVVLLGDGQGTFSASQVGYASPDGDIYGSALGDFDGDHRTDFVMSNTNLACGCDELAFAQGTGSDFVPTSFFSPLSHVPAPSHTSLRAGDLDRDGLADVVGIEGTPWLLLGHGDFTFASPQSIEMGPPGSSHTKDLTLADVDGDGVLDVLSLQNGVQIAIRINQTPPSGWTDLGQGLAGSDHIPSLLGVGELQAGSPGALKLTHANPDKLAALVVGPTGAPTALKGGMLVPVPPSLVVMLGTSPSGTITLPWNAWPHLPPGTDFFFQYAIVDSAAPAGASLSNAVRALQP